jgi:hypothetical protein
VTVGFSAPESLDELLETEDRFSSFQLNNSTSFLNFEFEVWRLAPSYTMGESYVLPGNLLALLARPRSRGLGLVRGSM